MRFTWRALGLVALGSAAALVVAHPSSAAAACVTGVIPSVEITGEVVMAGPDPVYGSLLVTVRRDNGSMRQVLFAGRSVDDRGIQVEDSYQGELPELGHRYTIVGSGTANDADPMYLSSCGAASVKLLADLPVSAGTAGAVPIRSSSTGSSSESWGIVVVVLLGVVAAGAVAAMTVGRSIRQRNRRSSIR